MPDGWRDQRGRCGRGCRFPEPAAQCGGQQADAASCGTFQAGAARVRPFQAPSFRRAHFACVRRPRLQPMPEAGHARPCMGTTMFRRRGLQPRAPASAPMLPPASFPFAGTPLARLSAKPLSAAPGARSCFACEAGVWRQDPGRCPDQLDWPCSSPAPAIACRPVSALCQRLLRIRSRALPPPAGPSLPGASVLRHGLARDPSRAFLRPWPNASDCGSLPRHPAAWPGRLACGTSPQRIGARREGFPDFDRDPAPTNVSAAAAGRRSGPGREKPLSGCFLPPRPWAVEPQELAREPPCRPQSGWRRPPSRRKTRWARRAKSGLWVT